MQIKLFLSLPSLRIEQLHSVCFDLLPVGRAPAIIMATIANPAAIRARHNTRVGALMRGACGEHCIDEAHIGVPRIINAKARQTRPLGNVEPADEIDDVVEATAGTGSDAIFGDGYDLLGVREGSATACSTPFDRP